MLILEIGEIVPKCWEYVVMLAVAVGPEMLGKCCRGGKNCFRPACSRLVNNHLAHAAGTKTKKSEERDFDVLRAVFSTSGGWILT